MVKMILLYIYYYR